MSLYIQYQIIRTILLRSNYRCRVSASATHNTYNTAGIDCVSIKSSARFICINRKLRCRCIIPLQICSCSGCAGSLLGSSCHAAYILISAYGNIAFHLGTFHLGTEQTVITLIPDISDAAADIYTITHYSHAILKDSCHSKCIRPAASPCLIPDAAHGTTQVISVGSQFCSLQMHHINVRSAHRTSKANSASHTIVSHTTCFPERIRSLV